MKIHLIAVYVAWLALAVTGVITFFPCLFPHTGDRDMLPDAQETTMILPPVRF